MSTSALTVRQQVWLSAWTAAVQSAKYNPSEEAKNCLTAFDSEFGEHAENLKKIIAQPRTIPFMRDVTVEEDK